MCEKSLSLDSGRINRLPNRFSKKPIPPMYLAMRNSYKLPAMDKIEENIKERQVKPEKEDNPSENELIEKRDTFIIWGSSRFHKHLLGCVVTITSFLIINILKWHDKF